MLDFITRFFRREEASKTLAKERLRLVLMSDRVSLAPDVFDEMKGEMLSVIRRYLEIDERALDMHFENLERQFALLASIPVLKVKSPEEVARSTRVDAHANGQQAIAVGAPTRNGAARNGAVGNGVAHSDSSADAIAARTSPRRRRRRRRTQSATESSSSTAEPSSPEAAPPSEPTSPPESEL